jgi:hypothetical protein
VTLIPLEFVFFLFLSEAQEEGIDIDDQRIRRKVQKGKDVSPVLILSLSFMILMVSLDSLVNTGILENESHSLFLLGNEKERDPLVTENAPFPYNTLSHRIVNSLKEYFQTFFACKIPTYN